MIEHIDEKLMAWVKTMMGDVEVSLDSPEEKNVDTVGIYLINILPSSPAHVTRRAPLQVMLQYLITVWSKTSLAAHKMLGVLLFSAMEHPEFEVDLAEMPAQLWNAFDIKPRPAFTIRLPLRLERIDLTTQRVVTPIEVQRTRLAKMQGVILGPKDIALHNAQVALPACGMKSTTDSLGRFFFDAVPVRDSPLQIFISARGREMIKAVGPEELLSGELIIHFDL
jgi:hypothetical protein